MARTVTPRRLETLVWSLRAGYHFCMDRSALSFVAMLGTWLLFGTLQSSVAASSNCTVGPEERTVLTTVLKERSTRSSSVLVVESRTDNSHFAATTDLRGMLLRAETSELLPQLKAAPGGSTVWLPSPAPIVPEMQLNELEREYNAKLSQTCSIPPLSNVSKLLVFKSHAQMRRIFSKNPVKGWSQFHRLFGEDAERLTLSRVAFDKSKQYALVHVSSGCSEMCGGGELYLLTNLNGNWVITRIFPTWAT